MPPPTGNIPTDALNYGLKADRVAFFIGAFRSLQGGGEPVIIPMSRWTPPNLQEFAYVEKCGFEMMQIPAKRDGWFVVRKQS
jgi:hypothetical protein